MRGTKTSTSVTVKVFVERNQVLKMSVFRSNDIFTITWSLLCDLVLGENLDKSVLDVLSHLSQVHKVARTGWTFDFERWAKVQEESLQGLHQ
ncbi:hypothetical protein WICPIJ_001995 [Wickerhamomyces pijperi]|uniref:Uncharacterized protein n=1 Tax=Wickerhamomyces pijperi TaxID=599730 RepID=A0A9P8Q9X7_WICPI|nr:hypothetical protein WICPIJ_001995 [Wickerhamomyces pijperi]